METFSPNGRHGKFWAREYDDVLLEDNEDFLDRYAYILCNAVKAGLVDKAMDWTSVSSLSMSLTGETKTVEVIEWPDWSYPPSCATPIGFEKAA